LSRPARRKRGKPSVFGSPQPPAVTAIGLRDTSS